MLRDALMPGMVGTLATSLWARFRQWRLRSFYTRLNQILEQHDFDGYVEALCQRFYADDGRPGLPPGRYFRLLLIGYFEGLDAERAIAWRAADSFALREFLGFVLPEAPPDHSTISRTRLDQSGNARGGLHLDAAVPGLCGPSEGEDRRHWRADAGSERRAAQHRPTRHGWELSGLLDEYTARQPATYESRISYLLSFANQASCAPQEIATEFWASDFMRRSAIGTHDDAPQHGLRDHSKGGRQTVTVCQ
jgi:Transposase domain (DUF772)